MNLYEFYWDCFLFLLTTYIRINVFYSSIKSGIRYLSNLLGGKHCNPKKDLIRNN